MCVQVCISPPIRPDLEQQGHEVAGIAVQADEGVVHGGLTYNQQPTWTLQVANDDQHDSWSDHWAHHAALVHLPDQAYARVLAVLCQQQPWARCLITLMAWRSSIASTTTTTSLLLIILLQY